MPLGENTKTQPWPQNTTELLSSPLQTNLKCFAEIQTTAKQITNKINTSISVERKYNIRSDFKLPQKFHLMFPMRNIVLRSWRKTCWETLHSALQNGQTFTLREEINNNNLLSFSFKALFLSGLEDILCAVLHSWIKVIYQIIKIWEGVLKSSPLLLKLQLAPSI